MAKVVYAALRSVKPGKYKGSVTSKRVKCPDGSALTVHTVDADSRTFGDDLSYVFQQNVRKARRENKRLVGSSARVPAKA